MPRQALIVGLGLIGGSIALRLRDRGWRVRYMDLHANDEFERVQVIDEDSLLILATPADVAIDLLRASPPRSGTITSVCSVMTPLRAVAGSGFVAGHPLAGSEESGFAAARGDLFERKPWFVDAADDDVAALVRECGAVLDRVGAAEHDEAVALTSHLPQVLSTALAALIAENEELLRFAGSGLETFLRLAGSDASIWKPVLEANRGNIEKHAANLERIVREMLAGDERAFTNAQQLRRRL